MELLIKLNPVTVAVNTICLGITAHPQPLDASLMSNY